MALQEQLNNDLITAMKEGVAARVAVLRLIKSAFKNEEIKVGHGLGEPEALKVLQREAKQRKESIRQYTDADRMDLADSEQLELEIIEAYLPQQMDQAELGNLVQSIIDETGASDMTQVGMVIGETVKRAEGRADGGTISQIVREKLAA